MINVLDITKENIDKYKDYVWMNVSDYSIAEVFNELDLTVLPAEIGIELERAYNMGVCKDFKVSERPGFYLYTTEFAYLDIPIEDIEAGIEECRMEDKLAEKAIFIFESQDKYEDFLHHIEEKYSYGIDIQEEEKQVHIKYPSQDLCMSDHIYLYDCIEDCIFRGWVEVPAGYLKILEFVSQRLKENIDMCTDAIKWHINMEAELLRRIVRYMPTIPLKAKSLGDSLRKIGLLN